MFCFRFMACYLLCRAQNTSYTHWTKVVVLFQNKINRALARAGRLSAAEQLTICSSLTQRILMPRIEKLPWNNRERCIKLIEPKTGWALFSAELHLGTLILCSLLCWLQSIVHSLTYVYFGTHTHRHNGQMKNIKEKKKRREERN